MGDGLELPLDSPPQPMRCSRLQSMRRAIEHLQMEREDLLCQLARSSTESITARATASPILAAPTPQADAVVNPSCESSHAADAQKVKAAVHTYPEGRLHNDTQGLRSDGPPLPVPPRIPAVDARPWARMSLGVVYGKVLGDLACGTSDVEGTVGTSSTG